MRLHGLGVLALGLVLGYASSSAAQVTTTGAIQLVVEDQQGGRLPGVTVSASAGDVVTMRTVVSDAEGVATLEALAPSEQYTVKAELVGFRDFTRQNVHVTSGQTTTLRAELLLSTLTEQVEVRGQTTPVVDTKSAIAGQDITLQLTEALPTGRSYQSYLQLVPGVLPDSQSFSGNPSSRSGVNWQDVNTNGNVGFSTDNEYYFEGMNVTDPVTGTFGANLNTEIIQEQKVITGAIPAEYIGSAGLISTVVTKSGSNTYHGSANYFFQNDKLVAENKHLPGAAFSSNDTAFTIGGPAIRNRVWGFGSFRYVGKNEDVNAQDTHQFVRKAKTTQKQGFAKGTWASTHNDLLSFMFLNDPFKKDGSSDPTVVANRNRARVQGGSNISGTYSRVWSRLLIDAAVNHHDAEITDIAIDRTARSTVIFQRTDVRALTDEQLGGYGQDFPERRPTFAVRAAAQYQWNVHRLKGGLEFAQHEDNQNLQFLGSPDRAQYVSVSNRYLTGAVNANNVASGVWSALNFDATNSSDYAGFISTINGLSNKASFYNAYDLDRDGTISQGELGQSLVFNSTAGNPNGQLNYYRSWMSALGAQITKERGYTLFVQDEFSFSNFSFNVGLHTERWSHLATTGIVVHAFAWTFAPRLSAAWDVRGDGSQKVSVFYGRYYDPIRLDMTNFAGSLSGATREEQVFANGQWVTYRIRGGPVAQDGFFTNTVKTPHTDEIQLQHQIDLGGNMSASTTYYHRQTRDIFEDFDPFLYTDPASYPGPVNDPNSLFLGWNYMGFDPNNPPVANFFLGTLKGGERNYNGLELVFRKRFANSWQGLASYNYLNAKGNAISDGNADFAGDVLWLDPRAPNMYGTVPGTIANLFKMAGSYTTKWGLELGASLQHNSGTTVNKTFLSSSRRLPLRVPASQAFVFAGITNLAQDRWIAPDSIGAVHNPGWGQLDARVQYILKVREYSAEFFLDLFNVTNSQGTTRTEDLVAGTGTTAFGDAITWVNPRRAFLGTRVRF